MDTSVLNLDDFQITDKTEYNFSDIINKIIFVCYDHWHLCTYSELLC